MRTKSSRAVVSVTAASLACVLVAQAPAPPPFTNAAEFYSGLSLRSLPAMARTSIRQSLRQLFPCLQPYFTRLHNLDAI